MWIMAINMRESKFRITVNDSVFSTKGAGLHRGISEQLKTMKDVLTYG